MGRSLTARAARLGLAVLPLVAAALTLAPPADAATIARVQNGTLVTGRGSISPTLSSASTTGTLLVAVLQNTATTAFSAPSGWTLAVAAQKGCCGRVEVWYG